MVKLASFIQLDYIGNIDTQDDQGRTRLSHHCPQDSIVKPRGEEEQAHSFAFWERSMYNKWSCHEKERESHTSSPPYTLTLK